MFLWLKLNVPDTFKLITVDAREREVLFVPGNAFQVDESQPCQYVRASYSTCSPQQMDQVSALFFNSSFEVKSIYIFFFMSNVCRIACGPNHGTCLESVKSYLKVEFLLNCSLFTLIFGGKKTLVWF